MKKQPKLPKPRPIQMKVLDIHIHKKDYPKIFPPGSGSYDLLKKSLKQKGMLTPIFVDQDGVLLEGHYRFWAWEELGNTHIPVVVVETPIEIVNYFTS